MDDIKVLDAVERYIRGEMNPDERLWFENLRKTNTEIDQLVVEHTLFLQQMNRFGEWRKFKTSLNDVHTHLAEQGKINSSRLKGKARVIYLWKRYKRVATIAAVIAGVTTLGVTALVNYLSPKAQNSQVQELVSKVGQLDERTKRLDTKLDKVDKTANSNAKPIMTTPVRYNGTGFLIDGKGYLVTNAHVVKNSKNVFIQNIKGEQFRVKVIRIDAEKDIAILKITDTDFKPIASLPYGIRKSATDIAEPIFTLGFPRKEIVYGEGYLSAKTGFNGDTLTCQISVAANPGNSGGPVFNRNGEVIGILSTKEVHVESAVFAIHSQYIYQAVEDLKKDTSYQQLKISFGSTLKGIDKVQQVKKIQDYVFMVKGD
jgi:serine protease Do